MGLIAHIRRWRYVYGWRLRYWWLDTPGGLHARIVLALLFSLAIVGDTIAMVIKLAQPAPAAKPHEAVVWFIVWAVIIIVSAIIGYMMASKGRQQVAPTQGDTPTSDDGQSVKHHFGTCWVDDSFLLAWKIVGRQAIKSKGGK